MKYSVAARYRYVPLLLLISTSDVLSGEFSVSLYSDVQYSNNVGFATTATEDDVSQTLGLSVNLTENRKRFNADASFNLEQEHYYNDSYSDQTSLTTGFGIFNFDIVENFLDWRTTFTRTEVLRQSSDTATSENTENRNVLRTGPSMNYRVSRDSVFGLAVEYINVENSDEQAADTERVRGNANYDFSFNSITRFSLNGAYDAIIEGDEEFETKNLGAGFVRLFPHGELEFNAGVSRVRSDRSELSSGNFFDLSFRKERLFWHDVLLSYRQDISDTSIGFERDEVGADIVEGDVSGSLEATSGLDIIERSSVDFEISRSIGGGGYLFSGFLDFENYRVQENDEKSRGLSLLMNKDISPSFSTGLLYSFSLTDFIDDPQIGKEKTHTYRIDGQQDITRNVQIGSYLQYEIRMNGVDQVREYEELSMGVTVTWMLK